MRPNKQGAGTTEFTDPTNRMQTMRKIAVALLTSTALLASGAAIAQQGPAPSSQPPSPGAPAPAVKKAVVVPPAFVKAQAAGQTLVRDRLIGAKVYNKEGAIIGDIEDLILAPNNQVVGVIMGIGGFLGAGEKKVGVQYWALQFLQKDGKTQITLPVATKEVLGALEPYQRLEARKTILERAREKAQELTDKTKESAKDAAETAREKAGPALEKAKEAAGSAYEKAKDAAGSAIEKAKEAAHPAEKKQ